MRNLKKVKKNSLDLNNKNELQQDKLGVYKIESKENESMKHYITNYNIISAKCIDFIYESILECVKEEVQDRMKF